MPTFAFEVEYAKSGRSACKKCKNKIDKDLVRLGFSRADTDPDAVQGFGCSWHHFGCFPQAKGKAWFKKHLPEGSPVAGMDALRPEDRAPVEQLLLACRGEAEMPAAPAAPPSVGHEVTPAKGGKKRKALENDDAGRTGSTPAKAARAQPALTAEQTSAIEEVRAALRSKSVAWLGAALAKNGLPKAGRKDELVDRVAENQVLGVPPLCALCGKKKAHLVAEHGEVLVPRVLRRRGEGLQALQGPRGTGGRAEDALGGAVTDWERGGKGPPLIEGSLDEFLGG